MVGGCCCDVELQHAVRRQPWHSLETDASSQYEQLATGEERDTGHERDRKAASVCVKRV